MKSLPEREVFFVLFLVGTHPDLPQTQIVLAGQIIVLLDPILESLHGLVGDTERRLILLAKLGALLHRCGGHAVLVLCESVLCAVQTRSRRQKGDVV